MRPSHELSFCEDRHVPQVMAFIDRYFRAGHPLSRRRDLFDWQYGNGPDARYNLVLALEPSSAEILGMLGFIDGKRYNPALAGADCLWLTTWQVNPAARIPSLGFTLVRYLQEHVEHSYLASSGIRAALKPMYRALGFAVCDLSHHFLLNPDVPEHHIAVIPPGLSAPPPVAASGLRLSPVTKTNFPFDPPAGAIGLARTPAKSAAYFYRRYSCHPFYDYRVFQVLRGSTPSGLLATRTVTENGAKALRVVDLLLDARDIPELGAPLLDLIVDSGCEYGDLLQAGLDGSALSLAGFRTVTGAPGVVVPNHFEPFVRQNIQITACFRGPDRGPFVVCKGDCDQDRPNLI